MALKKETTAIMFIMLNIFIHKMFKTLNKNSDKMFIALNKLQVETNLQPTSPSTTNTPLRLAGARKTGGRLQALPTVSSPHRTRNMFSATKFRFGCLDFFIECGRRGRGLWQRRLGLFSECGNREIAHSHHNQLG